MTSAKTKPKRRGRKDKQRTLVMLAIVLCNGLFQISTEDRIPVGYGFGYDGQLYASLARNFPQEVRKEGMGNERAQRILPSAVIYVFLRFGGLDPSNESIIRYFQMLNLTLLVVGVFIWAELATLSKLTPALEWLGFLALFFNYPNAKMCYYYATLTDTSAFFLGLLTFYLCSRQAWVAAFATMLIGFWGSSTLLVWMAPFVVFRMVSLEPALRSWLPWLVSSSIATVYAVLVWLSVYWWEFLPPVTFAPLWREAIPISLAIGAAYILLSTTPLLQFRFGRAFVAKSNAVRWLNVLAMVAAFVFCGVASDWITGGAEGQGLIRKTLIKGNSIPVRSVAKPAIFLVAHLAYFGPLIGLVALRWKQFCKTVGAGGIGFVLFTLMVLGFGMSSESRHLLVAYPALVTIVLIAMREETLPRSFLVAFSIWAILSSRAWFFIGTDWVINDHATSYPAQYFFMGSGPWLESQMYWVHLLCCLVALVTIQLTLGRSRQSA